MGISIGAVVENGAGLFIVVRIERSVSGQQSSVDGSHVDQISLNRLVSLFINEMLVTQ